MNSKVKEPLFHIVKRDALPWQCGLRIRLLAILAALVVCGILTTVLTGINPVQVYVTIFMGAFGTARKSWITFQNVAILLLISLALTPAFRMRFWNIGGEGQVLIGGLAAAACMICLAGKLPNALIILLMFVTSLAAGAVWGLIPAFFKAKWNTNETLSTLMMNYIATQLVAFFTIVWEMPKGSGKIGIINQKTNIGWLPNLFGSMFFGEPQHRRMSTGSVRACPKCGMTLDEIADTGMLGCAECYNVFAQELAPYLTRIHGRAAHVGRIPRSAGGELKLRSELNDARTALKKAIDAQEFEQAAQLRDRIKELDEKLGKNE